MNYHRFEEIETISPGPMLFITGDSAHSRQFSADAFRPRPSEPQTLSLGFASASVRRGFEAFEARLNVGESFVDRTLRLFENAYAPVKFRV